MHGNGIRGRLNSSSYLEKEANCGSVVDEAVFNIIRPASVNYNEG